MKIAIRSIVLMVLFTLLLGVAYPLFMAGVGRVLFSRQAKGSLVAGQSGWIGSNLIGQKFTSEKYFHPRPSSAGDDGYDAQSSGASNLGPTSKKLIDQIAERSRLYREINHLASDVLIPADAVTGSGSGLDPHISVPNANLQADRIASSRGISKDRVAELIAEATEQPMLWCMGEARVNVLKLNLALDREKRQ